MTFTDEFFGGEKGFADHFNKMIKDGTTKKRFYVVRPLRRSLARLFLVGPAALAEGTISPRSSYRHQYYGRQKLEANMIVYYRWNLNEPAVEVEILAEFRSRDAAAHFMKKDRFSTHVKVWRRMGTQEESKKCKRRKKIDVKAEIGRKLADGTNVAQRALYLPELMQKIAKCLSLTEQQRLRSVCFFWSTVMNHQIAACRLLQLDARSFAKDAAVVLDELPDILWWYITDHLGHSDSVLRSHEMMIIEGSRARPLRTEHLMNRMVKWRSVMEHMRIVRLVNLDLSHSHLAKFVVNWPQWTNWAVTLELKDVVVHSLQISGICMPWLHVFVQEWTFVSAKQTEFHLFNHDAADRIWNSLDEILGQTRVYVPTAISFPVQVDFRTVLLERGLIALVKRMQDDIVQTLTWGRNKFSTLSDCEFRPIIFEGIKALYQKDRYVCPHSSCCSSCPNKKCGIRLNWKEVQRDRMRYSEQKLRTCQGHKIPPVFKVASI